MVIGVTGNIGSGKSTVASFFKKCGTSLIDADTVAKEVVEKYPEYRKWLSTRFGKHLFDGETLLRRELGKIVFTDPEAKKDLDQNIKPYISRLLIEKIKAEQSKGKIVVVDAAMIFEWKNENNYDIIVAVVSDKEAAVKRAAHRLKISEQEARDRFNSQVPVEEKIKKSDYVIFNNTSLEELHTSAMETWEKIKKNFDHF